EKDIRNFLKADYAKRTPAAMQALARKLLEEGTKTTDNLAVKYVYFCEARDQAAQAGDVATSFAAVDEMSKSFQVDAAAMKLAALAVAARAPRNPEAPSAVAEGYAALAEYAAWAEDFEGAIGLAGKAEAAARAAQNGNLAATLQLRLKDFTKLRDEYRPIRT